MMTPRSFQLSHFEPSASGLLPLDLLLPLGLLLLMGAGGS
jgi:hypothetical protein